MLKMAPSQTKEMVKIKSKSLEETQKVASDLAKDLLQKPLQENAVLLLLRGNLGSGKTTFVKYLAQALGVKQTITSPTFVIFKKYHLGEGGKFENLFHFDCYRLQSSQDLDVLNFKEIISRPQNIVILEWPENVSMQGIFNAIELDFMFIDPATREITIIQNNG